ncbi:MAG: hypothetical protein WCT31_05180, partial [Candidatus Micrarchaeia archaeon]
NLFLDAENPVIMNKLKVSESFDALESLFGCVLFDTVRYDAYVQRLSELLGGFNAYSSRDVLRFLIECNGGDKVIDTLTHLDFRKPLFSPPQPSQLLPPS